MFHAILISHQQKKLRDEYIAKFVTQKKIHPLDQLFLNEESVGISDIRKLAQFVSQKPLQSIHKVIVIKGDNLTLEAQQGLLKLLEEPPVYVLILISVSQREKLLETILSRLIHIVLPPTQKTVSIENDSNESFWKQFLNLTPITRLKESIFFSERDEALKWLEEAIFFMRYQLISGYRQKQTAQKTITAKENIQILEALIVSYNLIERNSNLKLSLDHLALRIPYAQ